MTCEPEPVDQQNFFLFLVAGFVLQLLPHYGVGPGGTNGSRAWVLPLTLCGGFLTAWLMDRLLRRCSHACSPKGSR